MPKIKLSKNIWGNLILFGFMGQVAWSMENVYFNTFLFNYIGGTTRDISRMVALSAATAVITTFLIGTLSDKLNRRKMFIAPGYILWGGTVAIFALISRNNVAGAFGLTDQASIVTATVSIVIIMDCVMTFMGSTSNDASFNAWVTDVTVPSNRGTAEGVLSIMPILSTLIVTIGFGAGVTAVGYPICFLVLGIIVTACGFIGFFTIKDSRSGIKTEGSYFKDLFYGFRPSVIKKNSRLYLALSAVCIFSTAVQIFMPYVFIYLQHYLGFDFTNMNITPKKAIIAVGVLICVIAGAIGLGVLVDRVGKAKFIYPSVALFVLGLYLASLTDKLSTFGLLALLILAGYGLLMIILNATVRDFTPEDKVGLFQGVRMIFFVLIPMVAGPYVGNSVIETFASKHAAGSFINDFKEVVDVPVPEIFAAAAILGIFIVLPLVFIKKEILKVNSEKQTGN